jgi:hypothetical protein
MKQALMYHAPFYGNLYNCPVGRRLPDCPVYSRDHLSFKEKVYWFDGLKPAERKAMAEHHHACAAKRQANKNY